MGWTYCHTQRLLFFKNKNTDINPPVDKEDIKKNYTVGVRENSNIHSVLLKEGYTNLIPLENTEAYYRGGLYYKRVDLIIASPPYNIPPVRAKKFGLDAEMFVQTSVQAGEGRLFIAFSKDTSDEIISLWQNTLNDIKEEGLLEKLIRQGIKEARMISILNTI